MTRVIRFHEIGGPEVLKIDDIEIAPPGPGEVRIQVKALGLNRAEVMFRTGVYIIEPRFPQRLGYEASGVVESVGTGVQGLAPGDAVSVIPPLSMAEHPAYGEFATYPAELVVKNPEHLSWEEAAGTWMQYVTAYGALIDVAKLAKGEHVLITAASSSVGIAAIQIANRIGAIPIATTRTRVKARALQEAGAAHVIVTDEEDLVARVHAVAGAKGVRVVFDPIAGPGIVNLAKATADGGIVIVYGLLDSAPTPLPLFEMLTRSVSVRGYIYSEIVADPQKRDAAKHFILDGLVSGALKPKITKIFPFEQMVEAHRYLESNAQMGKIVVTL